ncbi:MAG: hypothetical protein AB1689_06260 [Thermodesulfobacteriota bacterium]
MTIARGILGGTTTMLTRRVARRAMHRKGGDPRVVPRTARRRHGLATVLAWAAAAGVLLALADVLLEQRKESARPPDPVGL